MKDCKNESSVEVIKVSPDYISLASVDKGVWGQGQGKTKVARCQAGQAAARDRAPSLTQRAAALL